MKIIPKYISRPLMILLISLILVVAVGLYFFSGFPVPWERASQVSIQKNERNLLMSILKGTTSENISVSEYEKKIGCEGRVGVHEDDGEDLGRIVEYSKISDDDSTVWAITTKGLLVKVDSYLAFKSGSAKLTTQPKNENGGGEEK